MKQVIIVVCFRTLTDSSRGHEGALGDDLAARKAGDGGALRGQLKFTHNLNRLKNVPKRG